MLTHIGSRALDLPTIFTYISDRPGHSNGLVLRFQLHHPANFWSLQSSHLCLTFVKAWMVATSSEHCLWGKVMVMGVGVGVKPYDGERAAKHLLVFFVWDAQFVQQLQEVSLLHGIGLPIRCIVQ